MKTFVVNLKRSLDRRKYMQTLLKDFPYPWEFFEAVDGREIKNLNEVYNEKKAIHFYGKALTRGEVGCALSHLGIYKKMIDENIDKALILEDDIILEKNFLELITMLNKKKLHNDVILLGQSDDKAIIKFFGEKITDKYKLLQVVHSGYGTYAYMIDIEAAKKIIKFNTPIKRTADAWAFFSKFINIYAVEPNLVNPIRGENISLIDNMENRWNDDEISFYAELKLRPTIFSFIRIFFRKTLSVMRVILSYIKKFFLSILPAKRIE